MSILPVLICSVVLFNIVSCFFIHQICMNDKGIDIKTIREPKSNEAVYLIGGCQSRTEQVFDFILEDIPTASGIYLIEYRNQGFNVWQAANDLDNHIRLHSHKATIISISLGYQISCIVSNLAKFEIAINPCIGKVSLQPKIKKACGILPVLEVFAFAIGWLAYLPFVKIAYKPYYSLRLLLDQFEICASNQVIKKYVFSPNALILSEYDEIINNDVLYHITMAEPERRSKPLLYTVPTTHFGTTDNSVFYHLDVVECFEHLQETNRQTE